jgi:hypothetical protein
MTGGYCELAWLRSSRVFASRRTSRALQHACGNLRALHDCFNTRNSWVGNIRFSRHVRRDVQWWAELPKEHNGRTIWRSPDQAILHSGASRFARGGVLNNQCIAHGI